MPPAGMADGEFLDGLLEKGHQAFELAFTRGFPWKERRCAAFAREAADRGIGLSVHAPYFAVLTVADEDRAKRCRAALEHAVKLGAELDARIVVAHLGARRGEQPEELLDRMRRHLDWIGGKVDGLGVGVGLETAGKASHMGSLGDIALLSDEFPFVRPVVDWAHVHAVSGGGLRSVEAFAAVIGFLRDRFPGWKIDPVHTQFSDVLYGEKGEIRHLPYGEGTLRIAPLVRAAGEARVRMTVISESRDARSHDAIHSELLAALGGPAPAEPEGRPAGSGLVELPVVPRAAEGADGCALAGYERPLPYGEGTLRIAPLVRAAGEARVRMTVISESRDARSHDAIHSELLAALGGPAPAEPEGRPAGSGLVELPVVPRAAEGADGCALAGYERPLRLSNLDKPFFPDGYTKGDLISYYASAAEVLLPHLEDRAIVMSRYPDGAEGASFYEKHAPGHQPEWMPLAPLDSARKGRIEYVTARNAESLMWLANMGCIEIHPWLSRVQQPDRPDFAVFDLDPAEGASWERTAAAARLVGTALERLGLAGYPKTSGSRGIHIYVPLDPVYEYDRVRSFVSAVGRLLAAADPDGVTMSRHIPSRKGKVFIDSRQNRAGATIASVYSVRPRPGAPVSTPIRWEELDRIRPDDFTIGTLWDRISRYGDLFAPVLSGGQRLEEAEKALELHTA